MVALLERLPELLGPALAGEIHEAGRHPRLLRLLDHLLQDFEVPGVEMHIHEGYRPEVAGGVLRHFLQERDRGRSRQGQGSRKVGGPLGHAVRDVWKDHGPDPATLEPARRSLGRVDREVGGGGQRQVGPVGLRGSEGDKRNGLSVFCGLLDFGPGHLGQYDVFRHNTCTRAQAAAPSGQRFARFVLLMDGL